MKARSILRTAGSAALLLAAATALCGVLYPLAVTGVAWGSDLVGLTTTPCGGA